MFDEVLDFEKNIREQAFQEGLEYGREVGYKEGYELGLESGHALAADLDSLEQSLKAILEQASQSEKLLSSSQKQKVFALLQQVESFERANLEDTQRPVTLSQLKSKCKEICLLFNQKLKIGTGDVTKMSSWNDFSSLSDKNDDRFSFWENTKRLWWPKTRMMEGRWRVGRKYV